MESTSILVLIVQLLIIFFLFLVLLKLFQLNRITKLEKRLSRFTLDIVEDDETSFTDDIEIIFNKLKKGLNNFLKKSKVLSDYSKKYEKYIDNNKINKNEEPMDYISSKFIFGLLIIILDVVSKVIWYRSTTFTEIAIGFIVGFFIPDFLLISKTKYKEHQEEEDLLKAITIMNNAFKSGNSIMQAIEIVSKEVEGPLRNEFKKMHIDLSYGLSLETVFERFSKRVNIEEVKYMTTSLTILNKTGGNVAKVFSTIEKGLFSRRKLKQEMKSLVATANLMYRTLIVVPFALIGLIVLINPTYFMPLVSNTIGIIVLLFMIIIYTLYIILIKKIMKVDGV